MMTTSKTSSARGTVLVASLLLVGLPPAFAEPPAPDLTWEDLGYPGLPEGFSTEGVLLFQALSEARGSWSFEGRTAGDEAVKGSLEVGGNPKGGMMPVWKLSWSRPAEDPSETVIDTIIASPREDGIEWMLARMGPVKKNDVDPAGAKMPPTMFRGSWNRKQRTMTWTEADSLPGMPRQKEPKAAGEPRQSFEMEVAADGGITIRNGRNLDDGMLTEGRTLARTAEAPAEPVTLTGRHPFKTVAEIRDRRIAPCLPPQATEISLLCDRGGHFARYKVAEADFKGFLDRLWEEAKGNSAHKRNEMHGEGEPADPDQMARVFKPCGWELPDDAVVYYSPSKGSGAMTAYYYDRKSGIACHSAGYW